MDGFGEEDGIVVMDLLVANVKIDALGGDEWKEGLSEVEAIEVPSTGDDGSVVGGRRAGEVWGETE